MDKDNKQKTVSVTVKMDIPIKRIQDLLCCAFEGGSNYWYVIDKFGKPPKLENRSDEREVFRHLDYPTNPGGFLVISASEERIGEEVEPKYKSKVLDLATIQKGLELMSEKAPKNFADFVTEQDDADTGDVFLQMCLFGEVVFG